MPLVLAEDALLSNLGPAFLAFHPVVASNTQSPALKPTRVSAQFFSSLGSLEPCPALLDIPDKLLPHPSRSNFSITSVKCFQTLLALSPPLYPGGLFLLNYITYLTYCFFITCRHICLHHCTRLALRTNRHPHICQINASDSSMMSICPFMF